ncbi:MAG: cytochrome c oxidase assembly protein [Solirubrobacterales bacterium]|nr:cytochrome c oxidase assembly protein [Solirubrobacterales bacterium]
MSAPSLPQLLVGHWSGSWSVSAEGALFAILYVWAARRVRGHWPVRRTLSFLAGIGCVLVALESGIDSFDDRLLSVHMVQHMLLLMVAPLLLLCGQPVLLVLRALPPHSRPALASWLARLRGLGAPLTCLAVFYATVLLTHLSGFYDATLTHPALHDLEHGLYLLAGLALWWPVLDCDPVPARRLGGLGRLIYVLAAMPPMALLGAYLNRHGSLIYPHYAAPARALGISAVADQQQAGALMWVAGSVVMVAVGLWASIAALLDEERRQALRDARPAAGSSS